KSKFEVEFEAFDHSRQFEILNSSPPPVREDRRAAARVGVRVRVRKTARRERRTRRERPRPQFPRSSPTRAVRGRRCGRPGGRAGGGVAPAPTRSSAVPPPSPGPEGRARVGPRPGPAACTPSRKPYIPAAMTRPKADGRKPPVRLIKLAIGAANPTVGAVRSNADQVIRMAREMAAQDVTVGSFPEQVLGG